MSQKDKTIAKIDELIEDWQDPNYLQLDADAVIPFFVENLRELKKIAEVGDGKK